MKLEFNLPNFQGFYNSILDVGEYLEVDEDEDNGNISQEDYDSIDWHKTEENTTKTYLDVWLELNAKKLAELGIEIEYLKVDSPKYYNFETDKLVCVATFNKTKLLKKFKNFAKENKEQFEQYIKDQFTSYDGFNSFYSNEYEDWINTYLKDKFNNVVFEVFLELLTEPLSDDDIIYNVMEDCYSMLKFKN